MKAARLAAAALLAAFVAQCVLSMRLLSATFDEHAHLPAGYTYWKTGDLRLNPQHPPLVKLLAGFPLLFLKPNADWTDESWAGPRVNQWRFGKGMLYAWHNDADRLLFWGRVPMVLLAVLGGLYVFRWSAERFGPRAGVFGLLLYAFCPNVIAHARFVTMDAPLATFLTITLYYLWRHRKDGTRRSLVLCALSLGLALATKFSALLVAPVVLAGLALTPITRTAAVTTTTTPTTRPTVKKKRRERRERTAATAAARPSWEWLASVGIAAGIAAVVVWVLYLFPTDPAFYWKGVQMVNRDHRPDYWYYLMGQFKQGTWWYYFAAAFLFKTPLPVILSIAVAAVLAWRTRAATGRADLVLLIPAAVFFAATSAMADNLGLRYVLPVFPLLFVFASRLGESLTRTRTGLAAVIALAGWQVFGALRIYPDYFAYFNEAAGGPANGYHLLDDSNLDWGQDLKRLAEYLKETPPPAQPVRVCYELNGDPGYYGVRAQQIRLPDLVGDPTPGFYAIGVHCLVRLQAMTEPGHPNRDWLARFKPVGRVGWSFYLFRIE
jgi:hypothetical protein